MSKYVCLECYHIFDEPKSWKEDRGEYFGSPCYEKFSGCPDCGGAYIETHRCDCCGEYINTDTYVEIGDERYCENCFMIKSLDE